MIQIVLEVAAVLISWLGIIAAAEGVSNIQKAEKLGQEAQEKYEIDRQALVHQLKVIQNIAGTYDRLQIQVKCNTMGRLIRFLEGLGQRTVHLLKGLEGFSSQEFQEYQTTTLEAQEFATGNLTGAGVASASQDSKALLELFDTPSPKTAMPGVNGAEVWNATLIWLGGGSLAIGSVGMALGTVVIGGIAVAPALLMGGLVLRGQGQKALAKARQYEAKVNLEIAQIEALKCFYGEIQERILALDNLVKTFNAKAIEALDELENQPFQLEQDVVKFQHIVLLIKVLTVILKIPIVDQEGNLNPELETLSML